MDITLWRDSWRYYSDRPAEKIFSGRNAGTISYTAGGLLACCFFLLLGAFGFNLTMQLVSILVPKQLHDLGASNTLMALLLTTLPSTITMICNPAFSF